MSLGGGYQQSKSSSEQRADSYGPLGSGMLRYEGQNALGDYLFGRTVDGVRQGQEGLLDIFRKRTTQPTNYGTPALTASGLLPEQQGAFTEAVNQAMGRASSNFANRGFLRPENIQAIAGSAAQNVAPQFAPFIERNVAQRTQAPLVQEDLMRQRFADLLAMLGFTSTTLGGQSISSGKSESSGFQASLQGSAGGGKPAQLGGGSDK